MFDRALRNEVGRIIRSNLREGFLPREQIVQVVVDLLCDEHKESRVRTIARRLLPSLIEEFEEEKRSWPKLTDCDRLDAAFEELNALGIMARHHWWCCGTCGSGAIPDEFDRLGGQWDGVPIKGYIYYHQQDTESAVEGGGVCLDFGSCLPTDNDSEYEAKSVEIARLACDVLAEHGLVTEWPGTFDVRPHIKLNWQRRARPPRFCEDSESST